MRDMCAVSSVLSAPLQLAWCECQSKKSPSNSWHCQRALPALLTVHLSGICSLSRNCIINPPAICIPHRCRSLPLTSLLLLELISLPPSCLRDASPLPQPISRGSAAASERTAAESGNIPNSPPLSLLPPGQGGGDSERGSAALPCVFFKARLHIPGNLAGSLLDWSSCVLRWEMRSETTSAC